MRRVLLSTGQEGLWTNLDLGSVGKYCACIWDEGVAKILQVGCIATELDEV